MPERIAYVEHASDIVSHAVGLIRQGRVFTLVTSVEIKGGAAREVGSLAIVDDTGAMVGYLSNGCIDRDIQTVAADALRTGKRRLLRYGDGSPFVDLKLPCGGALSVLIDPAPDLRALEAAHAQFQRRQVVTLRFVLPGHGAHPPDAVSFDYAPKSRLMLAGRGAVFRAMAQTGHAAGFELVLLSPDETDLDAVAHLAAKPVVHLTAPDAPVQMADLDAHSAFLTLFHDHDWEPHLLRAALASPARFVGSLGSTRTHAVRLARLEQLGVAPEDLDRLRGPIGLVPSLREAQLIAISAMAEIVQVLGASDPCRHAEVRPTQRFATQAL